MPTYVVTAPNGKKYRVEAPAGASEDEVLSRVKRQAAPRKPAPKEDNWLKGLALGAIKPIDNLANLASNIPVIGPAVDSLGEALGMPKAKPAIRANNAARKANVNKNWQIAGNIAGSAPIVSLVPGGPFAQGAASTGLVTDSNEPDKIAAEMLVGGILGKGADVALRGAGRMVAPKVSKAMKTLSSRGVRVTPGQAVRQSKSIPARALTSFEDRATSLPGPTGQLVRAGREQAADDFVRGGINESLQEIGAQLPDGISGYEAVKFMQEATGKAYDDALVGMQLVPDDQLTADIAELAGQVNGGSISEPFRKQFNELVRNEVVRRANANGGNLAGDSLKTVLSALNKKASDYGRSSTASEREFGAAVGALADALEAGARRSSAPESVAALNAADRAFARRVRVELAASKADGGMFSPAQLQTAIRQADPTVRKRAVAAGESLMQPYAQAGRDIMPAQIGDSGTAGREAMWNPAAWAFDLASYLPYKAAQKATPYLTREPGPTAMQIGGLLGGLGPVAAPAVPMALYGLLGER